MEVVTGDGNFKLAAVAQELVVSLDVFVASGAA
jgi:hypothetical protein